MFSSFCVAGLLSAGLVATGCGGSDDTDATAPAEAGEVQAQTDATSGMPEHGQDLTVTGCLTASLDGRSYALTPSDTAPTGASQAMAVPGGETTTLTYELVGDVEDVRRHANTMVTARGRSDASSMRDTEMERRDESEQQPSSGSGDTPVVETKEEVEVDVRRLHVTSVVGTGETCPSIGG